MEALVYAFITVFAWGTWLVPSQRIEYSTERVRTFYVALANMAVALLVAWMAGVGELAWGPSLLSAVGGIVWAISGHCAFYAARELGIARAMGIWSPLNVGVSFVWGLALFGEFRGATPTRWVTIAVAVALALWGLRLILFADTAAAQRRSRETAWRIGVWAAVAAGVLWGSYFIPLQVSGLSVWAAVLPMSAGMLAGSVVSVAFKGDALGLGSSGAYVRSLSSGLLWGVGNYGSLKLMEHIGTGKGFTIAQLCLIVNALWGIYLFKQPRPGTSAARRALKGVALAALGGIMLGVVRFF